jgi:hypothetical protein
LTNLLGIQSRSSLYKHWSSKTGNRFRLSKKNAYLIQKQIASNLNIGAWKLGGTNFTSQKAFKTKSPYFGPIKKENIIHACDSKIDLTLENSPGELEIIAKVINIDKNNIEKPYVYELYWGIEYPTSLFDFPSAGLPLLIADCCAAGHLIIGPKIENTAVLEETSFYVQSGEFRLFGDVSQLTHSVDDILNILVENLKGLNLDLEVGQFIATGGMSACVPLPTCWELSFLTRDKNES